MYMLSMWSVYVRKSERHTTHTNTHYDTHLSCHKEKGSLSKNEMSCETECHLDLKGRSLCFSRMVHVCIHNHPSTRNNQMKKTGTARLTQINPYVPVHFENHTQLHIQTVIRVLTHTMCRNKNTRTGAYNTISQEGIKDISLNKYQ